MARPVFAGSFTRKEPIPEDGIAAAVAVMRLRRLHRYNLAPGERPETSALETEFAASIGARYCLACASGGYAMQRALWAWGARRIGRIIRESLAETRAAALQGSA